MTELLNLSIMVLCYVLASLGFLCGVFSLIYGIHVAIVFQRFNDGIKDWSISLDESTKEAIYRSAREILSELDQKISEANLDLRSKIENVEPINEKDNE